MSYLIINAIGMFCSGYWPYQSEYYQLRVSHVHFLHEIQLFDAGVHVHTKTDISMTKVKNPIMNQPSADQTIALTPSSCFA